MYAMVLTARGAPLVFQERPDPIPGSGEVRVKVSACGVCRTDLHVVDGELPDLSYPIIPGHEVVGRIDALGAGVSEPEIGTRVGVPWLGFTCGVCPYCRTGKENLCDHPKFTGYTSDGGFASYLVADARYCFPLGEEGDDAALAPLLCAGLIGWRSLVMAGDGKNLGIYGFGAAGHIVAQVAKAQGRSIYAFTRRGDEQAQSLALSLGAAWASVGRQATGRARRCDHLCTGGTAGAAGASRRAQRRTRRLRRHPYVRHSLIPLQHSLGRAADHLRREFDASGWN
jgi:propanol-preferring alcohol dehydrogenase